MQLTTFHSEIPFNTHSILQAPQEKSVEKDSNIEDHHLKIKDKAAIILQSYMMPDLLRQVFKKIPFLAKLEETEQNNLSFLIAKELKNLDTENENTNIRYDKKTEYPIRSHQKIKPPVTFYIKSNPVKKMTVISINEKKSEIEQTYPGNIKHKINLLGSGTYKDVYSSIKLYVQEQLITAAKWTIALPKYPNRFDIEIAIPNEIHQKLYKQFQLQKFPGRLAKPPKVREHIKLTTQEKKQELTQVFYPSNMRDLIETGVYPSEKDDKLISINFACRLRLVEEIFETINSIHELNIMHCDITPGNVLLKEEKDEEIHTYINDFDLATEESIGSIKKYYFWDVARQMGLISHSSDIIGAMLTAIKFLYNFEDDKDFAHDIFKKSAQFAFSLIVKPYIQHKLNVLVLNTPILNKLTCPNCNADVYIEYLKILSYNPLIPIQKIPIIKKLALETEAGLKLMELFCKYFDKENAWWEYLLGSCIAYYAGLSARDYRNFKKENIITSFEKGYKKSLKQRLRKEFKNDIYINIRITQEEYDQLDLLEILTKLNQFYKEVGVDPKKKAVYEIIVEQHDTLCKLKDAAQKSGIPNKGDPELFRLLSSKDPIERALGRKLGYQFFGRASDLQHEIHKILNNLCIKKDSLATIIK